MFRIFLWRYLRPALSAAHGACLYRYRTRIKNYKTSSSPSTSKFSNQPQSKEVSAKFPRPAFVYFCVKLCAFCGKIKDSNFSFSLFPFPYPFFSKEFRYRMHPFINSGQSGIMILGSVFSGSKFHSFGWCQHNSCPVLSRCSRMPFLNWMTSRMSSSLLSCFKSSSNIIIF